MAACGHHANQKPRSGLTIGLFSSLPLIWHESGDIRGQLSTDAPRHWAMSVLGARGKVAPLDTLAKPKRLPLASNAVLVLAQPQPLTPDENVALDTWVREGGRLLLFADPMLTAHSDFALGDPRRPQALVMLSPILRHWGLELQFDPLQAAGERQARVFGINAPIDLAGRFVVDAQARCRSEAQGLAVDCTIGRGRVVALADAAVFDGDDAGRRAAFSQLLDHLIR